MACTVLLSFAGCSAADDTAAVEAVTNDMTSSSASNGAAYGKTDGTSAETGTSADSATSMTSAATHAEKADTAAGGAADADSFITGIADAVDGAWEYAAEAAPAEEPSFAGAADIDGDYLVEIEPPYYEEKPKIDPEAGLLTGGEWRDNDHWNDWVSLYQSHDDWNTYRDIWDIDFEIRQEIIVTANGEPVEGAVVTLPDGDGVNAAVTDNLGRAYLFLDEEDEQFSLEISYGEVSVTQENVDMKKDGTYNIDMSEALTHIDLQKIKMLDLMLMIDTTGSMMDELEYLQKELEDVITRVKADNGNIPVRISVNYYRDTYDEYVIKGCEFTDDIDYILSDLAQQNADGGGDFPEAVHTAMDNAINEHDWSDNATKLMFLVLDAPPHEDEQIVDEVNDHIEEFAEEGVRIIPIASSGIDKSTEYLLRTMAFMTGGTYTFLTDDSGIGGSHIEPTIGDYEVEKLNDMMVRIIGEYLK